MYCFGAFCIITNTNILLTTWLPPPVGCRRRTSCNKEYDMTIRFVSLQAVLLLMEAEIQSRTDSQATENRVDWPGLGPSEDPPQNGHETNARNLTAA